MFLWITYSSIWNETFTMLSWRWNCPQWLAVPSTDHKRVLRCWWATIWHTGTLYLPNCYRNSWWVNRELTQQGGWKTQDGRMTKKCGARLCIPGLARHFFVILPSWVFQPSCSVSSLMVGTAQPRSQCLSPLPPLSLRKDNDKGGRGERPWERGWEQHSRFRLVRKAWATVLFLFGWILEINVSYRIRYEFIFDFSRIVKLFVFTGSVQCTCIIAVAQLQ